VDSHQLVIKARREPLELGEKTARPAPSIDNETSLGELRKRVKQLVSLPGRQRGNNFVDM
jgi:hypothetical protein